LRLSKVQLSLFFNVSDLTIYLWERNKVEPSPAQIPRIIEFLGRDPFERTPENLGDKIREYRRVHGLTKTKLAEQLGIDVATLVGLENGKHKPTERLLAKIQAARLF